MSLKYRTSAGTSASNFTDLVVKVGDTLPIGTEVDYDGQTVPAGWQEVDDPNVYSTAEKRIGTWIDGKPLYRKVFKGNFSDQLPEYVKGDINTTNLNIDKPIKYNGYIDYLNPVPIFSSIGRMIYLPSQNIMRVYNTEQAYYQTDYYLILEYTKTTD